MYDRITKRIDQVFERAKLQNQLDNERLMKDFEREGNLEKQKKEQAKSYQQLTTEWNTKIQDMKTFKQQQYQKKRQDQLEKLEKKENSIMMTKSNINSTISRFSDNFNTKIEYVKSRIYQQTEESEKDRIDLHDRILQKINSISSKKNDKLQEIQDEYHKKLEEKMKKISESTDLIKKLEQKKIKDRELKKIEKFGMSNEETQIHKQLIEVKRSKEKKKFEDVRINQEEIEKNYEKKNLILSNKIKLKKSQKLNQIYGRKLEEYITKRQSSYDKFSQNFDIIKKKNNLRNIKLLKLQQIRNRRSNEKARSVDISKDNIRENTLLAHMEISKKLQEIYTKLYNLGEESILRKSNEERKEKFNFEMKKKVEEEKKITEEKNKRSGGFFATEIRV